MLAEEFVRALAAARARAVSAAEGGSVNGAEDKGTAAAATAGGRRSTARAGAAPSTTTATAGASPATSSPASPAAKETGRNGGNHSAALVAEALRDEGNAAFRSGDFASAAAHYSAAAAADPTCPLALSNRAAAHLKLLDYESAERDATLSLQIDHRQPKALLRRGIARAALSGGAGSAAAAGAGGLLLPADAQRRERQLLAGARGDLEAVLALEPNNRQARAELEALKVMMVREEPAAAARKKKTNEIEPAEEEKKDDFFV